MESATRVQIQDKVACVPFGANALGKGMNPSVPPAIGKLQDSWILWLWLDNQFKIRKENISNQLYSA